MSQERFSPHTNSVCWEDDFFGGIAEFETTPLQRRASSHTVCALQANLRDSKTDWKIRTRLAGFVKNKSDPGWDRSSAPDSTVIPPFWMNTVRGRKDQFPEREKYYTQPLVFTRYSQNWLGRQKRDVLKMLSYVIRAVMIILFLFVVFFRVESRQCAVKAHGIFANLKHCSSFLKQIFTFN